MLVLYFHQSVEGNTVSGHTHVMRSIDGSCRETETANLRTIIVRKMAQYIGRGMVLCNGIAVSDLGLECQCSDINLHFEINLRWKLSFSSHREEDRDRTSEIARDRMCVTTVAHIKRNMIKTAGANDLNSSKCQHLLALKYALFLMTAIKM